MTDPTTSVEFLEQIDRAVASVSDQAFCIEELDALPIALLQTESGTAI